MLVCGVVVAYAPRCASLSPNGLACEASSRSQDNLGTLITNYESSALYALNMVI